MKQLIDLFNKKYGKQYGVIDDSFTNEDTYKIYKIIKTLCADDTEMMELLNRVKLPEPKTAKESIEKININVSGGSQSDDVIHLKVTEVLNIPLEEIENLATPYINIDTLNLIYDDEYELEFCGTVLKSTVIDEDGTALDFYYDDGSRLIIYDKWFRNTDTDEDEYNDKKAYITLNNFDITPTTDFILRKIDIKRLSNDFLEKDLVIQNSITIGIRNEDSDIGEFSCAIGDDVTASGGCSHAEGNGTSAIGVDSHAEGLYTTASEQASHAEGNASTASGYGSHAEGGSTTASGYASHAEGNGTYATKRVAHAEGDGTTASGEASHAEGRYCNATSLTSHAEGDYSEASGYASHAEGNNTHATGNHSHTEGCGTTASGETSHAEGGSTTASGNYSHAEGDSTEASGEASHAEGSGAIASGDYSHAENYASAEGTNSHAEGYWTYASSANQHVQGKFNIKDTTGTYAHIVGNGTADKARSNAYTLDWSGNAWYAGKLTQEGTPTEDKDLATKKYVDEKTASIDTTINNTLPSNGLLTLTTDKIQTTTLAVPTDITLPTVTGYTEIHLFFEGSEGVTITTGTTTVRWKTSPTISTGNLYEIVFTYINDTIGWIGDCLSYSA